MNHTKQELRAIIDRLSQAQQSFKDEPNEKTQETRNTVTTSILINGIERSVGDEMDLISCCAAGGNLTIVVVLVVI